MYFDMVQRQEMITNTHKLTRCSLSPIRRRPSLLPGAVAECCASVEWLPSKMCVLQ